jgi:CheY-like chemotaxis protein
MESSSTVAGPTASVAPRRPDAATAAVRATGRILVVEDSAINQQVALGILNKLGYRADAVANGLEALEALARIGYTAVLMDCQMPEMDGYAASAEIRRREGATRHTPIIGLTASAMKGDRERCLAAGMDDYLSKPVRGEELDAMLRHQLGAAGATAVSLPSTPPAAAPAASPVVIDDALLAGIGPAVLATVLQIFLKETPVQLAAVRAAAAQGDGPALVAVAHRLRGEAAALGARELQACCAAIEELAGAGTTVAAGERVAALGPAFDRARAAFEARAAALASAAAG